MPPTIILLNGTSSSGKTSVARFFQESASELWLLMSLDSFLEMFPSKMKESWPPFARLSRAYYDTAALWVRAGYNLIVDTVIDEQDSASNCVRCLSEFRVYTIGLYCPLEELSKREKLRTDREAGLAQRQYDRIHKFIDYDLELDTSALSIKQCVDKISRTLCDLPNPKAFPMQGV